jgi:serine/threonine protein kinase
MAFEMLTKKAPFPDHQSDVLSRKRFDPSTRIYLKECHIDHSEGLENIIERCLSLSVERRYQRADEIITDIELLRAGKALTPDTVTYAKRSKGFFTNEWKKGNTGTFIFGPPKQSSTVSWISITNIIIGLSLIVALVSQQ